MLKVAAKGSSALRHTGSYPECDRALARCKRRALESGPGDVDEYSFQATFPRRRGAGAHSHLGAVCAVGV